MSKHRVIGEMKNGQWIHQCLKCKTVWTQFYGPGILIKCPECTSKSNDDISIQERVAKIHARGGDTIDKLRSSTPFHLKISQIKETDWDQVLSDKITKIYKILMEPE